MPVFDYHVLIQGESYQLKIDGPSGDACYSAIDTLEVHNLENGQIGLQMKCPFAKLVSFHRVEAPKGSSMDAAEPLSEMVSCSSSSLLQEGERHENRKVRLFWQERHLHSLLSACRDLSINSVVSTGRNAQKWSTISSMIMNDTGDFFDAVSCKNKWLNHKRDFKAHVDDQTRTGAGRKEFKYFEITAEILKDDPSIKPAILGTQSGLKRAPDSEIRPLPSARVAKPLIKPLPTTSTATSTGTNKKRVIERLAALESTLLEEEEKRLKSAQDMHRELVDVIERGVRAFERYVNLLERKEESNA